MLCDVEKRYVRKTETVVVRGCLNVSRYASGRAGCATQPLIQDVKRAQTG